MATKKLEPPKRAGRRLAIESIDRAFRKVFKTKKPPTPKCTGCGYPVANGETFCGECACEDDCCLD